MYWHIFAFLFLLEARMLTTLKRGIACIVVVDKALSLIFAHVDRSRSDSMHVYVVSIE